MNRTRRWEFVKQDAIRFAGLGLSDAEIGRRLEVDKATVGRWRKQGKLGVKAPSVPREPLILPTSKATPAQWAKSVRAAYSLDATDEQLVTMAEACLVVARDPNASAALRFQAMREFRSFAKQLALVARSDPKGGESDKNEPPKRETFAVQKRSGADPRALLQAVK